MKLSLLALAALTAPLLLGVASAQAPEGDVIQRIATEAERLISMVQQAEEQNDLLGMFVPVFAEADPERLLADSEAVTSEWLRERALVAALVTLAVREPDGLGALLLDRPEEIAHQVCLRAGRRIGRGDPDAALAMAEEFARPWHEAVFRRGLAMSMLKTDSARAALVAEDIEGQEEREHVLRRVATALPPGRAAEALALADRCYTRWIRCAIRAELATRLVGVDEALAKECVEAALADWQRIKGPWQIAQAAAPLARAVTAVAPGQASAVLDRFAPEGEALWQWVNALTVLATVAPQEAGACAEQVLAAPPAGEEGRDEGVRAQLIGVIAGVDLQAGLGLAGALDEGLLIQAAARAAQVDPEAGKQLVLSLAGPMEANWMMAGVAETLANRDLKAAAALVNSVEDVGIWTSASAAIAAGVAADDPEGAAGMLETIAPRLSEGEARLAPLAFRLGLWDPARTAELIDLIESPPLRACALAGLAAAIHEADPDGAQALAQQVTQVLAAGGMGESAGRIHDACPYLVRVDPDAAFDLLGRLPDTQTPDAGFLFLKLDTLRQMGEQVLRQRGAWLEEED